MQRLVCAGGSGAAQPIIQNVKDFTIQYLTQATDGDASAAFALTNTSMRQQGASERFMQYRICPRLEGAETIDTAGAKYKKCDGTEG